MSVRSCTDFVLLGYHIEINCKREILRNFGTFMCERIWHNILHQSHLDIYCPFY